MPSGLSYLKCLDRSISTRRGVWVVFNQTKFYRNSFNANRVDPDQASHSVASDLGLHCLPVTLLWDAGINGLIV